MKIAAELKGKEVVDNSGNKVGEINDVEWDPETNMVESIIITEGGASAKIGMREIYPTVISIQSEKKYF